MSNISLRQTMKALGWVVDAVPAYGLARWGWTAPGADGGDRHYRQAWSEEDAWRDAERAFAIKLSRARDIVDAAAPADTDCISLLADLDAGKPVGAEAAATIRSLIAEREAPSHGTEGGSVPFDRDALIALIMEETTDDIVADGWDRLGKPNVLVQGCRYIRRNAPPSPEGYANPEASAKQFAGCIADRVLKVFTAHEEVPAELLSDPQQLEATAEAEARSASSLADELEDMARCMNEGDGAIPCLIASAKMLRAQPQAREDAQHHFVQSHSIAAEGGCKVCGRDKSDHPAPDALRVAVDALEAAGRAISAQYALAQAEYQHLDHLATKHDKIVQEGRRAIREAISALQAEQTKA